MKIGDVIIALLAVSTLVIMSVVIVQLSAQLETVKTENAQFRSRLETQHWTCQELMSDPWVKQMLEAQ